jgi:hypothetical protein
MTPAKALGAADRTWTIGNLIGAALANPADYAGNDRTG